MRKALIVVPAALMLVIVTGCAKQPATMPASATAPAPSSGSMTGRTQPTAGRSDLGTGAVLGGATTGSAAASATR